MINQDIRNYLKDSAGTILLNKFEAEQDNTMSFKTWLSHKIELLQKRITTNQQRLSQTKTFREKRLYEEKIKEQNDVLFIMTETIQKLLSF